jgi:hypothetical protein
MHNIRRFCSNVTATLVVSYSTDVIQGYAGKDTGMFVQVSYIITKIIPMGI